MMQQELFFSLPQLGIFQVDPVDLTFLGYVVVVAQSSTPESSTGILCAASLKNAVEDLVLVTQQDAHGEHALYVSTSANQVWSISLPCSQTSGEFWMGSRHQCWTKYPTRYCEPCNEAGTDVPCASAQNPQCVGKAECEDCYALIKCKDGQMATTTKCSNGPSQGICATHCQTGYSQGDTDSLICGR